MKNRISLIIQAINLKKDFPDSAVTRFGEDYLGWDYFLTPSPYSNTYQVRLIYKRDKGVKFYVVEPKLQVIENDSLLPHVYSTPDQRLCLYYPGVGQWDATKLYVDTIIPWAAEWLLFYELWLITGKWLGGGVGHSSFAEKKIIEDVVESEPKVKKKNNKK